MKKREMNFELLRIVAMCMIIGLHYLDKGNVLGNFVEIQDTKDYVPWIFEAFFFCSVNVYVLITGYFLVEKEIRIKKVFSLWGQVLFYALVLGGIAVCSGLVDFGEMNIYRLACYVFPVVTEHYWFVTSYILLYILLPFINPVLLKMDKKQMRNGLLLLLVLLCLSKTLVPLNLAVDKNGYDVLWFLCLYLTGAYYKRFGFKFISTKLRGIVLYVLSSAGVFLCSGVLKIIYTKTGHLQDIVTYAYSYNHLLCYLAAVGLFVFFASITIKSEKGGRIIGSLAGASFGVYLLHEHIDFRYVWQQWIMIDKQAESVWFPIMMIGSILVVFIVCAMIEQVRKIVFQKIGKAVKKK